MTKKVSAAQQDPCGEVGKMTVASYRDWIASLCVGEAVRVRHVLEDRDVPGGRLLSGTVIYRSAGSGSEVRLMVRYYDCGCERIKMFDGSGGNACVRLEHPERLTLWQRDDSAPHRYEFGTAAPAMALASA